MSFEVIDSLFTIKADGIMTVAMAAVILLIGFFIKSKVKFLEKYCIPAPVVGGFLFMFTYFYWSRLGTFYFRLTVCISRHLCLLSLQQLDWAQVSVY